MVELYWPHDYRFIDWDRDFEADEPGTYDVDDDAEEQYLDRGWLEDESESDADGNSGGSNSNSDDSVPDTDVGVDADADADVGVDEDEGEGDDADGDETPNIEDMEYDELQSLAKEHDIPANQSATDLRDELANEVDGA